MPKYRVRPGYRHGPRDEFGPDDLVEYTEYEASGFLDKLELVEEGQKTTGSDKQKADKGKTDKGKSGKGKSDKVIAPKDPGPEPETPEIPESSAPEEL